MTMKAVYPSRTIDPDISIRAFKTPDDLYYIEEWVGVKAACLGSLYESIALADFIESLMVCSHGEPLLEADICQALFDEIGFTLPTEAGDYTLRLLFPFSQDNKKMNQALLRVLEYAFTRKKATRILLIVDGQNKLPEQWIKQINFIPELEVVSKANFTVYVLTKKIVDRVDRLIS